MKGINRLGTVITKVLEIFHWVGAALMAAASVCAVAAPEWVGYFVGFDAKDCCGASLEAYGFEVNAAFSGGSVDMMSFLLFGILKEKKPRFRHFVCACTCKCTCGFPFHFFLHSYLLLLVYFVSFPPN